MLKKAVNTVTMLLVVLGVSVVSTKASPRVNLEEVSQVVEVNRAVDAADYYTGSFVALVDRPELVEVVNESLAVNAQNMRVLDKGFYWYVGHQKTVRLVGDTVGDPRDFVTRGNLPAVLNVRNQGDHVYLSNRCNFLTVTEHPNNQSHLAFRYPRRVYVQHQLGNELSGQRLNSSQKVPVFEKANVLKDLTVVDVLAVLKRPLSEASGVTTLRRAGVYAVDPLVQVDAAGGGEFGFVV
jgi:hypothetical protein